MLIAVWHKQKLTAWIYASVPTCLHSSLHNHRYFCDLWQRRIQLGHSQLLSQVSWAFILCAPPTHKKRNTQKQEMSDQKAAAG